MWSKNDKKWKKDKPRKTNTKENKNIIVLSTDLKQVLFCPGLKHFYQTSTYTLIKPFTIWAQMTFSVFLAWKHSQKRTCWNSIIKYVSTHFKPMENIADRKLIRGVQNRGLPSVRVELEWQRNLYKTVLPIKKGKCIGYVQIYPIGIERV